KYAALKGQRGADVREARKSIKEEERELWERLQPQIVAGKEFTAARHNTKIYVQQDTIGEEYLNLVLNNAQVYASDITIGRKATHMKYTTSITMYANSDYKGLKKAADELGVKYTNQQLPALARKAFKQHRDRDGSAGWEKSTLNVAVSTLAAMYPAQ